MITIVEVKVRCE